MNYDVNVEYHSLQLKGVFSFNISELFVLYPNYPNPLNPLTTTCFRITESGLLSLKVLNMFGQDIITLVGGWKDMGYYKAQWQGRDRYGIRVYSRVYFSVFQDCYQVQVV